MFAEKKQDVTTDVIRRALKRTLLKTTITMKKVSRFDGAVFIPRGGGTPLYGLYRYEWPQRVWFFSCFGHRLGIDFSHFEAILVINRVLIFAL